MLKVWFYDPTNDSEGFFNKAVSYSDPPFCHCELQFPNSMTCSIYMGSTVCFRERSCFSDAYTVLEVPATHDQIQVAYEVCHRNYTAKKKFSTMEMLSCISPWKQTKPSLDSQYTFCSKLVAEALQSANVLPQSLSTTISPSALYRALLTVTDVMQRAKNTPMNVSCTTPIFGIEPIENSRYDNVSSIHRQTRPQESHSSIVIDFKGDTNPFFE